MSPDSSGRLREPPQLRFAGPAHLFDLEEKAEEVLAEPATQVNGHQQVALYRHGPMTVGLFVFEKGGSFPHHAADGVVSIHALSGSLEVRMEGEVNAIDEGQILVLAPGVEHDIVAQTRARMLLTVCLETD